MWADADSLAVRAWDRERDTVNMKLGIWCACACVLSSSFLSLQRCSVECAHARVHARVLSTTPDGTCACARARTCASSARMAAIASCPRAARAVSSAVAASEARALSMALIVPIGRGAVLGECEGEIR